MKPEDTEVWEPVPSIVTPGNGSLPPSDAVVLFSGKNMSEWNIPENTEWVVEDDIVTIVPLRQQALSFSGLHWRLTSVKK
jgi:hypothetical protein